MPYNPFTRYQTRTVVTAGQNAVGPAMDNAFAAYRAQQKKKQKASKLSLPKPPKSMVSKAPKTGL